MVSLRNAFLTEASPPFPRTIRTVLENSEALKDMQKRVPESTRCFFVYMGRTVIPCRYMAAR